MAALSLVDTHAHLDMEEFDQDREEVIARAIKAGLNNIVTVGIDLESSKKAIELAKKYQQIMAAVGVHPNDSSSFKKEDIVTLEEMAKNSEVVAIGETGLDFYRKYTPHDKQIEVLKWQLDLAVEMKLPIIIHCRQAEKDMIGILREWTLKNKSRFEQSPGVIHCFNGDANVAQQYLDMGFYLSVGGYIGYPASRNSYNTIQTIPLDRLLIETDAPFLPPQTYRGKRNEPAYVAITAGVLANIIRVPPETIARVTTENALRLFCRR